ncbi:MAG: PDZ domain-containing protein [Gammaproteobacteria bacterium]|nr:PDZ domain-containing protein [Gammaproteobacteria bacterium]
MGNLRGYWSIYRPGYQLAGVIASALLLSACNAVGHKNLPVHGKHSPGSVTGPVVQSINPGVISLGNDDDLADIIPKLATKRVLYVGETHDRYEHHLNQLEIIKRLYQKSPEMAIGMEFFQQPFQSVLDDYIAGRIDDRELLKRSEWFDRWRYDYRLYQPIFQFARERGIPMIALNLSKEIIGRISEVGIEGLDADERSQVPDDIDNSDQVYQARLRAIYDQHAYISNQSFDRFLDVQLSWDEGMAERAAQYLHENPERQLVVLAGSGHLMYGSGIPQRVSRRVPAPSAIVLPAGMLRINPGIADFLTFPEPVTLPQAGLLGVYMMSTDAGVEVAELSEDGAAIIAGLKKGDLLLRVNQADINKQEDVKLALMDMKPGDLVEVELQRKKWFSGSERKIYNFMLGH